MKKKLTRLSWPCLCTLLFAPYYSNAQDLLWEKSYGGQHAEYLFDAVPTADYGFILAGSSLSVKIGNKSSDGEVDLDYWVREYAAGKLNAAIIKQTNWRVG